MKLKLSQLHQNKEIAALRPVNKLIVSQYQHHYREGAEFPPIVVTRVGKHYDVVSGYHRRQMYLNVHKGNHAVEVLVRTYADTGEMIADAARENLTHGYAMDGITRRRYVLALCAQGWTAKQLSELFKINITRIEKMGSEYVFVQGEAKPVKGNLRHLVGTKMSAKNYEAHIVRDTGVSVFSMADQLTRCLTNNLINRKSERDIMSLRKLTDSLNQFWLE